MSSVGSDKQFFSIRTQAIPVKTVGSRLRDQCICAFFRSLALDPTKVCRRAHCKPLQQALKKLRLAGFGQELTFVPVAESSNSSRSRCGYANAIGSWNLASREPSHGVDALAGALIHASKDSGTTRAPHQRSGACVQAIPGTFLAPSHPWLAVDLCSPFAYQRNQEPGRQKPCKCLRGP